MNSKTFFRSMLLLLGLSLFGPGVPAQDPSLERFYTPINPVQPTRSGDKIEVVEVFWYGCPHCYRFEPYIDKWRDTLPDDVSFRRAPGMMGRAWIPHARAFYTAEKLGVLEQIHNPLFAALHRDQAQIFTDREVRDYILETGGVEGAAFDKIYNSKEVDIRLRQALSVQRAAQLSAVPAIIVNGKYLIEAGKAGSFDNMLKVIDHLIDKERSDGGAE